jgi:pantoate kinase
MDAKAFCPGHITGFFQICDSDDILSMGSRGAGLCITLGATSSVKVEDSAKQQISVMIDGKESKAEVTTEALRYILGHAKSRVEVNTTLDLPQSQGFGMSAAGSLSSALALAHLLGKDRQMAFEDQVEVRPRGRVGHSWRRDNDTQEAWSSP